MPQTKKFKKLLKATQEDNGGKNMIIPLNHDSKLTVALIHDIRSKDFWLHAWRAMISYNVMYRLIRR